MAVFHIADQGEFPWDRTAVTLAEGIALEDATGRLYDELVTLYNARRRQGVAAFAWLALRRHGRDVPWREFLAGLDVNGLRESFADEVRVEDQAPAEGAGEDVPADPPKRPAAARTRRTGTARSGAGSARK